MSECSTSIIECLRDSGVQPTAYSSSQWSSSCPPTNAIYYPAINTFETSSATSQQWWMVDFSSFVKIGSYQIKTGTVCYYIRSWTAFVSSDNKTFDQADSISRTTAPVEEIFTLNTPVVARYFRINGSATGCSGAYRFAFSYVKFFGETNVSPPRKTKNKCTSVPVRRTKINFVALIIIMCT